MTHEETEIFLKDCPRLFSDFLNNSDFCLPYGSGWFDILHKCCLELEVLNKDGIYIVFENADYIISEIDKNHNKSGLIRFCVKILKPEIIYSRFHSHLESLATQIIGRMMDKSCIICERCGVEYNKVNNIIENSEFKCICDSCLKKLKGIENEQCDN